MKPFQNCSFIAFHDQKFVFLMPLFRRNDAGQTGKQEGDNVPSRAINAESAARRLRTEKPRTQKLLNAQERKLRKELDPHSLGTAGVRMSTGHDPAARERFSAHLQHWFFTLAFSSATKSEDAYSHFGTFAQDRARCVYSLILALVAFLQRFFQHSSPGAPELLHVLNTHIVDDTSTRIRGPSNQDATTIYTIMNTVQAVHVRRKDAEHCESFRVPTPLTCLDKANTSGIHRAFSSSALITSSGLGQLFQRFGLAKNLVECPYKSFVFMGDSLRANDAAFTEEVKGIISEGNPKHLALRLRCAVHQLALARKPAVLFIPRLWGTVVRLSHLYEQLSFRKAFAKALATVITNSFIHLEVPERPAESQRWQALSDDLRDSFRCRSKVRMANFNKLLQILNGDLESDCIVHYCMEIPGQQQRCCAGPADALSKCLQLAIPFFARGYPAPLLYRFKHYDEAVNDSWDSVAQSTDSGTFYHGFG